MPCLRSGTVEHSGKWYCWQHDPSRTKTDEKKRNAKLAALVTEKLAALLERLASDAGHLAHEYYGLPEGESAEQDEQAARALAARIREALALEVNDEG